MIQDPLHEHRDEMASKFENRIDYVDISAYGIGKVKDVNDKKKTLEENLININQQEINLNSTP